jgi:hypothetical protein
MTVATSLRAQLMSSWRRFMLDIAETCPIFQTEATEIRRKADRDMTGSGTQTGAGFTLDPRAPMRSFRQNIAAGEI